MDRRTAIKGAAAVGMDYKSVLDKIFPEQQSSVRVVDGKVFVVLHFGSTSVGAVAQPRITYTGLATNNITLPFKRQRLVSLDSRWDIQNVGADTMQFIPHSVQLSLMGGATGAVIFDKSNLAVASVPASFVVEAFAPLAQLNFQIQAGAGTKIETPPMIFGPGDNANGIRIFIVAQGAVNILVNDTSRHAIDMTFEVLEM